MKRLFIHRLMLIVLLPAFITSVMSGCRNKTDNKHETQAETKTMLSADERNDPQQIQSYLYAAYRGDADKVLSFLDQGMDINQVNRNGQSALMMAAYNGHLDLVRLCLKKGAGINDRDAGGRTPLMYAASGPFTATVKYLLNHGADPNTVDQDEKWTALMYAAAEGHLDVVRLLLKRGAVASVTDVDGDTAESFARKNGHIEVADWIKDHSD
ncbi:MAG: ankyrin repeat domain-containing protein [Chlorobi bacterium]|nr:ankyrin repeat domain-containing protein [Chlorobiota bacterium]